MLTLRTYLRGGRKDAAGQSVIYFIVGDEWISSTCKVEISWWDAATCSINRKHPKYYLINPEFQLLSSRAQQCISNFNTAGQHFNRKLFESFVFTGPENAGNPCALKLIDEYINTMDIGFGRAKQYKVIKNNLQVLLQAPRLLDIDYTFLLRFQQYCRKCKNVENTVRHKTRALKAIVHFAQKKGLLQTDPLAMVKVGPIVGNKNHLTAHELEQLEQLYQAKTLAPAKQNVLRYFLFSCYTGLRYGDVSRLKYFEIKNNCVVTFQDKTEKPVVVPLISKALELLQVNATGKCFVTHGNQVTNKYLKMIMAGVAIEKKITFHCSRHTFATLSIYWGIPQEVVAELMGVDFKTVKIYAKIVDQVKSREMLKWEQRAG